MSIASTSKRSAPPLSKVPVLLPASLVVPRVLNLTTVIPAIAGNRLAAFLRIWLSIIPPAVGSGCKHKIDPLNSPSGAAISPTKEKPSTVVT